MANSLINFTLDEIRKNIAWTAVDLTATDNALELVPAATGKIPVIVCRDLNFTGTWTVGIDDDTTTLVGAQTFKVDGHIRTEIGEDFLKGSSGNALNGDFTKTSGNCKGVVGYVYINA